MISRRIREGVNKLERISEYLCYFILLILDTLEGWEGRGWGLRSLREVEKYQIKYFIAPPNEKTWMLCTSLPSAPVTPLSFCL